MRQIPFTKEGFEKIKKEKQDLLTSRPAAVEDLAKARAMGDLSENGYYKAAKQKLSGIDFRVRQLTRLIQDAVVVEKTPSDEVQIGSMVVLHDGSKEIAYSIVGGYESNPLEGKISQISPLGKELIGKKVGDNVTIVAPKGVTIYSIKKKS